MSTIIFSTIKEPIYSTSMLWYNLNHWVPRETNIIKLPMRDRTVHQTPHWIVDHGLRDEDFSFRALEKERPWRKVEFPFKPIKSLSDFPLEPKIRWEFWNKIGVKVVVRTATP